MGYLCANFGLPRPLCSRLRPDVRDRQTDVRRKHRLIPSPMLHSFFACFIMPQPTHCMSWWISWLCPCLIGCKQSSKLLTSDLQWVGWGIIKQAKNECSWSFLQLRFAVFGDYDRHICHCRRSGGTCPKNVEWRRILISMTSKVSACYVHYIWRCVVDQSK